MRSGCSDVGLADTQVGINSKRHVTTRGNKSLLLGHEFVVSSELKTNT
jgi:hypothetical protein